MMRVLSDAGIDSAELLARHIMCEATQLSAAQIILNANEPITPDDAQRCDEVLARACKHEPLSRIIKQREFYGRKFILNQETLDPRPDSETVIDAVLELAKECGWHEKPFRFIDVGTGTGCLAITLLAQLPNATALATDISNLALDAARQNAIEHAVSNRLELKNRDCLKNIAGPFDLLISNPPYIRTKQIDTLAPEVKQFDPRAALDGGADGLEYYRTIARGLGAVVPSGWAVFEVGAGQADDVSAILTQAGYEEARTWQDLSGHTRCVAGRAHCT